MRFIYRAIFYLFLRDLYCAHFARNSRRYLSMNRANDVVVKRYSLRYFIYRRSHAHSSARELKNCTPIHDFCSENLLRNMMHRMQNIARDISAMLQTKMFFEFSQMITLTGIKKVLLSFVRTLYRVTG